MLAGTERGGVLVLVQGVLLVLRLQVEELAEGLQGAVEELAMTEDMRSISSVVSGRRLLLLACPLLRQWLAEPRFGARDRPF